MHDLLTFASWAIYAALKTPPAMYVIISNVPGVACTAVTLGLFGAYGREKKR